MMIQFPTRHSPTYFSKVGNRVHRQVGFSLVELMIAILITLFLVAGVIGIVAGVRGNFNTQDGLTRIQETQRFLLSSMSGSIRMSGYYICKFIPATEDKPNGELSCPTAAPFVAGTYGNATFAAGQSIGGTTGVGAANDSITVRYQGGPKDGLMNCQGDDNKSSAVITWTNTFAVNASNQLTCTVTADAGAVGTPTVLVDGVSSIKIKYGIDTDSDGSVDRYLTSTEVGSNWQFVSSVQLTITLLDPVNSKPGKVAVLPQPLLHIIKLMNQV